MNACRTQPRSRKIAWIEPPLDGVGLLGIRGHLNRNGAADHRVLIRGGLRTLLRARGDLSICGEGDNGIEAVKLAIQAKPDVVIVGVNLPDINGIEVTGQIRKASPDRP